jgi:Tfp pilus assembly protein PilE
MKRRKGLTLIEMVIAIGGVSVVMLISTRCCFHIFHEGAAAREFAEDHRQWLRLAETFRRDVHAANKATVPADGRDLTLSFEGDRTIRYSRSAESIERQETNAAKKPPPERFRIWDGDSRWSLAPDGRTATLTCHWHTAASRAARAAGQSPPPHELKLEAAVGSDQRFTEARQ